MNILSEEISVKWIRASKLNFEILMEDEIGSYL